MAENRAHRLQIDAGRKRYANAVEQNGVYPLYNRGSEHVVLDDAFIAY